jgi:small-conductance mechanosensitive channel
VTLVSDATSDVFSPDWLRTSGVRIAIVLFLAVALSWLGSRAVRRLRRRLEGDPGRTGPLEVRRTTTVATLLVNTLRVVVWTVTGLLILSEFGVSLGPLLASAGIAGIALSFGAQSLVKDFLSGFFVLLENQFAVGDMVELGITGGQPIAGRVEQVTLRVTVVRTAEGTLATTGNGNIVTVRNLSRGSGEVRVEVKVAGHELESAQTRLDRALHDLRTQPDLLAVLSSPPEPVGVLPTAEGGVVAIVRAEAPASRRQAAEDELRRQLTVRLLAPADGEPDGGTGGGGSA